MEQKFFATPKKQKILLYSGIAFLVMPLMSSFFVPYSLEKLFPAILGMTVFAAIPALYFINTARKMSKNPTVIITESEIIMSQPFERKNTVALSSIKSIQKSSNNGIKLKIGFMKNARINAGVLSNADRERLMDILNEKIHI